MNMYNAAKEIADTLAAEWSILSDTDRIEINGKILDILARYDQEARLAYLETRVSTMACQITALGFEINTLNENLWRARPGITVFPGTSSLGF